MNLAGRWADRQLSTLELVMVVIVISLILFVLIQQMLKIFARAESSMLATSIMNINTALRYRAVWYVLNAEYTELKEMQGMNPFNLAAADTGGWFEPPARSAAAGQMLVGLVDIRLPGNYLGEMEKADPAGVAGGNWYFDRHERKLVYRVNNTEYFSAETDEPARAEFVVDIDYEDRNDNNRFDPGIDDYRDIRLQPYNKYTWRL